MSSRATTPYQGEADADPKGVSWPGWTRTSVVVRFRAAAPLPTEQPAIRGPHRVLPPASRSYKERPDVGPRGNVRSAGVEPASTWPSTKPVYLIAARAHGAATRCRPGSPALRGRGRSRARRRSCPSWIRTTMGKRLPGLDSNQRGQGSGPCWGRQRPTRNQFGIPGHPARCAVRMR